MTATKSRPAGAQSPVHEFHFRKSNGQEPLPFKIDGELFHAIPQLPGLVLLEYAVLFSGGSSTDGLSLAQASLEFLRLAIVQDEWAKFETYAKDPANGMDEAALGELAGYLVTKYTTGDPLQPTKP